MSLKYSPKELASKILRDEPFDVNLCDLEVLEKTEKIIDKWALNLLENSVRKTIRKLIEE